MECTSNPHTRVPWNKGKLVGQKAPFKPKEVWAIRARLQMENRARELALFDLGIDSKLRACDLVKLRVGDVCHGDRVASRATVLQQKTQRPVQFEISPATREAVEGWMRKAGLRSDDYLFPSRVRRSLHLGTRQYARILDEWRVGRPVSDLARTSRRASWLSRAPSWSSGRMTCLRLSATRTFAWSTHWVTGNTAARSTSMVVGGIFPARAMSARGRSLIARPAATDHCRSFVKS
jgi:integrase